MPNSCHRALLVATFAFMPCVPLLAQGGATVTGSHANEEFCKAMLKQADLSAAYMKANPGPVRDTTRQANYFGEQKALNATLVKTAPASLSSDIVNFTRTSNAFFDVMGGRVGDSEAKMVATRAMSSPEHIAASKRMSDYCGFKKSASK